MSTIYLIRHGESQTNAGLPTILHDGAALTERGIEQAGKVAAYLKFHTSLDLIVTSYYKRSQETATFTQLVFPHVPTEEWMVQEFTYLASLHHEHMTVEDRKPLVDTYWSQADPIYADGPGSESFEALMKRAYALEERLRYTSFDSIAIFSHQQFITAFLWLIDHRPSRLTSDSMKNYKTFLGTYPVPNGGIIRAQFRHRQQGWQCKRINEHLEQPVDTRLEWQWVRESSPVLHGS